MIFRHTVFQHQSHPALGLLNKWFCLLYFQNDESSTEEEKEVEKLKHKVQEKEQLISSLQDQLAQAQAEQATQVGNKLPENPVSKSLSLVVFHMKNVLFYVFIFMYICQFSYLLN